MANRILLVFGNGLTISLLNQLGLSSEFPTTPAFPSPMEDSILVPTPNGRTRRLTEVFPVLRSEWASFAPHLDTIERSREYLTRLALLRAVLSTDKHTVAWSDSGTPGFQLRLYLWEVFRHVFLRVSDRLDWSRLRTWDWGCVLTDLFRMGHRIDAISYNYELFVESVLVSAIRSAGMKLEVRRPLNRTMEDTSDTRLDPVVLKPHGSIDTGVARATGDGWYRVYMSNCTAPLVLRAVDERPCPFEIPEIVPPGHAKEHLLDRDSDLPASLTHALRAADVIIVCGLSGAVPDRDELSELFSTANIRSTALVLHVDIASARHNDMAQVLRQSAHVRFLAADLGEVRLIPSLVQRHLGPRTWTAP